MKEKAIQVGVKVPMSELRELKRILGVEQSCQAVLSAVRMFLKSNGVNWWEINKAEDKEI